jgi:hypothetical protein
MVKMTIYVILRIKQKRRRKKKETSNKQGKTRKRTPADWIDRARLELEYAHGDSGN